jgi:hypothetical protein
MTGSHLAQLRAPGPLRKHRPCPQSIHGSKTPATFATSTPPGTVGQGGRQPSNDHWRRDIRAMRILLLDALELSHTEGKVPTIVAGEGEYSVALWSTSYGANGPARRCKNRRALPHPDPGEHSSDQQSATSGFHSTLSGENRSRESASPDDNAPEAKVGEARLAAPQSRL